MDIRYSTKFTGRDADEHRMPAFEAGQSLHGVGRSFALLGHFLATGKVRKRYPFSSAVQVYLHPPQGGSFESIVQILADPAVQLFGGGFGTSVLGNVTTDFLRMLYRRAVGQDVHPSSDPVKKLDEESPGDMEALVDAIEPALKLAHTSIGSGANNLIIITGDNNVVNFNPQTKRYLEISNEGDDEYQDISIGSYNVNQKTGRAYFHDLGKTVPFKVARGCHPNTVVAILHSLSAYAAGEPSNIRARFTRTTAGDGSTKRIIIYAAKEIPPDAA